MDPSETSGKESQEKTPCRIFWLDTIRWTEISSKKQFSPYALSWADSIPSKTLRHEHLYLSSQWSSTGCAVYRFSVSRSTGGAGWGGSEDSGRWTVELKPMLGWPVQTRANSFQQAVGTVAGGNCHPSMKQCGMQDANKVLLPWAEGRHCKQSRYVKSAGPRPRIPKNCRNSSRNSINKHAFC